MYTARLQAWLEESTCVTIHRLARETGEDDFSLSQCSSSIHDFGSSVAQATHEPVVVVTDWSVPDKRKNVRRPSHSSKLFHNTGA